MHEEDDGVLWKHTNGRTGDAEVRRSRRLVISTFATVGNYDYGFFWSLDQDGTIELEVKLTGILSVAGTPDGERPLHGRAVGPGVQAADAPALLRRAAGHRGRRPAQPAREVHAEAEQDAALDPYGNAVRIGPHACCAREREARAARRSGARACTGASRATPRATATASRPPTGCTAEHDGRLLARRGQRDRPAAPFAATTCGHALRPAAALHRRASTPTRPSPAPTASTSGRTPTARSTATELVVWADVGTHHFPRPEDWPVMPVDRTGLRLEPDGFFDRNPALDVPPPTHRC